MAGASPLYYWDTCLFLAWLREVGHGIEGVKSQLALYAKVFGGVVAVALAGYWFMFSKADRVEDAIARMETRLVAMDADLKQIAAVTSAGRPNSHLTSFRSRNKLHAVIWPPVGPAQADGNTTGLSGLRKIARPKSQNF